MSTTLGSGPLNNQTKPIVADNLPTPVSTSSAVPAAAATPDHKAMQEAIELALRKAGYVRQADGSVIVLDSTALPKVTAAASAQGAVLPPKSYTGKTVSLPPPSPPPVVLTADTKANATTFATNLDKGMTDFLTTGTDADGQVVPRGVTELTTDMLLAAFLKLQMTDPNNEVTTHEALSQAMSSIRKEALQEAQAKEQRAIAGMQDAQKKADQASQIATLALVVAIVAAVILIVATMGAGSLAAVPLLLKVGLIVACAACSIGSAVATYQASSAATEAEEQDLLAQRAQKMAQMAQDMVKGESEIIKLILESKNKTVEAVMQMLNAMFASTLKLQSAAMVG